MGVIMTLGLEVRSQVPALTGPLTPHVTLRELPSSSVLMVPIWEMSSLGLTISSVPYDSHSSSLDFGGPG